MLRSIAAREAPGLFNTIDSAGTADYHIGEPPDWRSVAAAARRGYDIGSLRARQIEPGDFERFELLLAMDRSNLASLVRIAPRGAASRAQLFLSYAPLPALLEVPDPYYGMDSDFERVVDLCEQAARGLIGVVRAR